MQLYQCVLDYQDNADSFVQICWAKAADVSLALSRVTEDAAARHFKSLVIREIQLCSRDDLPFEEVLDSEDLWYFPKRHQFEDRCLAEPPLGIIPIGDDDEDAYDFSDLAYGFRRVRTKSESMLRIDATRDVFLPIIQRLLTLFPKLAQIELMLSPVWLGGDQAQIFRRIQAAELSWIRAFIDDYFFEVLGNGYAALTIESDDEKIVIENSKTIKFKAKSKATLEQAQFICRSFGLEKLDRLPRLGHEIAGELFVSSRAMSAQRFLSTLARKGFYPVTESIEQDILIVEDI